MTKKPGLSLVAITLALLLTLALAASGAGYYWYSHAAVFGATMTPVQQQPYTSSNNFVETQFVNQKEFINDTLGTRATDYNVFEFNKNLIM